jgi:hypothetical protein
LEREESDGDRCGGIQRGLQGLRREKACGDADLAALPCAGGAEVDTEVVLGGRLMPNSTC